MEVKQSLIEDIVKQFADAKTQIQQGESAIFSVELTSEEGPWDPSSIYRLQTLLRSSDWKERLQSDLLEVHFGSGLVLAIRGTEEIERFCITQNEEICNFEWIKKRERLPEAKGAIGNVKLASSLTDETATAPLPHPRPTPSQYSVIRETEYMLPATEHISYKITAVRESQLQAKSMNDSLVLQSPVSFRVHVNIESDAFQKIDTPQLIGYIVHLHHLLSKQPMSSLPKDVARTVLNHYHHTIKGITNTSNAPLYFLAPKPITLEQQHLLDPNYGIVSIQENYAVTEKADGERLLMYISGDSYAYLINNTFEVFETNMRTDSSKLIGSHIDGEFVSWDRRKPTASKDLFAIFDIYSNGINTPLFEKPLMERVEAAKEIVKHLKAPTGSESTIDVMVKNHRTVPVDGKKTIFDLCNDIMYEDHPYHVDGLILTPTTIPVFAYYPRQSPKFDRLFYRSARWDRLFKWKPHDQNTIDFLVKQTGDTVAESGEKQRMFQLYNGQRRGKYDAKTIQENLQMVHQHTKALTSGNPMPPRDDTYAETAFRPMENYYPGMDTAKLSITTDDTVLDSMGQPIENDSIVEFAYDVTDRIWLPLRVRDDKTRMYRSKGKIGGAANDFDVALNIWRSIHNPVTLGMMCGKERVPLKQLRTDEEQDLTTESVYYAREVPREYSLSLEMLEFHNMVIKAFLYRYNHKKRQLLELACGKCGDLRRWEEAGYQMVLGIDVSKDNIVNPSDGAYARVANRKRAPRVPAVYAFLVGDVAKPLTSLEDTESRSIFNVLQGDKQRPGSQELQPLFARAQHGFDVVSCQFAIHYFFKDEQTLRGFMKNVTTYLSKGGVFVGTCMDGRLVDELLSSSPNGIAEGRKSGVAMWALRRRYQTPLSNEAPFGQKIDVYLEMTQQVIPEYLVNFEYLITLAEEYGLRLEKSLLFDTTLECIVTDNVWPVKPTGLLKEGLPTLAKDTVLRQFSALNRWFIFRKQ